VAAAAAAVLTVIGFAGCSAARGAVGTPAAAAAAAGWTVAPGTAGAPVAAAAAGGGTAATAEACAAALAFAAAVANVAAVPGTAPAGNVPGNGGRVMPAAAAAGRGTAGLGRGGGLVAFICAARAGGALAMVKMTSAGTGRVLGGGTHMCLFGWLVG